jgi:hypothetical protein
MRGSKTANLEFINMEVPEENVLGPLGGGLRVCLTVLDFGRTTFGATCTGAAKYLVERTMRYSKERYQFKRALSSFGLVKEKIAKMNAFAYAMEATTYLTAGLIDHQAKDFMLESAILKVFCSDSLWNILYDTMQIFGGRSFFTDQPFERMMRDARLNMIGEGSNEVMRAFIGGVGMRDVGARLAIALESLLHPITHFSTLKQCLKEWISKLALPKVPLQSPELEEKKIQLGKKVRSFGFAVAKLLIRYREQIVEQQLQLNRMATCAIALYTASATLSRLDASLQKKTQAKNEIAIAKLYCQLAFKTIDNELSGLYHNLDVSIEQVSDQLIGSLP